MKTLTIYLNEEKTSFRRITPSDKFGGDFAGLVNALTGSDKDNKNYHSYIIS